MKSELLPEWVEITITVPKLTGIIVGAPERGNKERVSRESSTTVG